MDIQAPKTIRVLLVEDEPDDADLIIDELLRTGMEPLWNRVETEAAFIEQLDSGLDVILADYHLPAFGALRALELQQARAHDVPVIVVSGTIGEEAAVECLKRGATDYVLKDRLARLAPAVERACRERVLDREKRAAEAGLRQLTADLERRVAERTAQLETINRELEAFSYSVSHDLRSPLLVISGFAELLAAQYDEMLDDNARDYLADIQQGSQRMAQLIEDFLRLAHVARDDLVRERVDLTALVQEVAEGLHAAAPGRAASFVAGEAIEARGDARLLRVALTNLLGNAWKYTRDEPTARIEFGTLGGDDEVVYFVRDNGPGFDPALAGRLFEPFQRLHEAKEYEGTGVGLATVRRIVERHAGRCWAEGVPGQGATFYFTLGS